LNSNLTCLGQLTFPGQRWNIFQDITPNFKHFFSHKMMFVKYATAYVVMPGGFGTLEAYTKNAESLIHALDKDY